jgi:hypothetical protein
VIFKNFFAESEKNALGKEILCREPTSWLLVKKSLASVFSVPRAFCLALGEFFIWLSAQNLTQGKD